MRECCCCVFFFYSPVHVWHNAAHKSYFVPLAFQVSTVASLLILHPVYATGIR